MVSSLVSPNRRTRPASPSLHGCQNSRVQDPTNRDRVSDECMCFYPGKKYQASKTSAQAPVPIKPKKPTSFEDVGPSAGANQDVVTSSEDEERAVTGTSLSFPQVLVRCPRPGEDADHRSIASSHGCLPALFTGPCALPSTRTKPKAKARPPTAG